jgi:hypothetical protein
VAPRAPLVDRVQAEPQHGPDDGGQSREEKRVQDDRDLPDRVGRVVVADAWIRQATKETPGTSARPHQHRDRKDSQRQPPRSGDGLDTPHVDEEARFRRQARAGFATAPTTFAVAGVVAVRGYPSTAAGLVWLGGGSLLLGLIYVIMYRV